jgi:putative transposase
MAKHAGVARHAYNWGLATCFEALEKGEKLPSAIDLHKRLVAEVKSLYSWYYEVSKCSPQQALKNLATAFKNWWGC